LRKKKKKKKKKKAFPKAHRTKLRKQVKPERRGH